MRRHGAVPATIGVLDGVALVGMDADELTRLAGSAGQETTVKISRRDLAYTCGLVNIPLPFLSDSISRIQGLASKKLNGGTTIAGTMVLAHLAGIKVFASGGLGGVHRGGESSLDISADLTELGRTSVTVISSGCKSFLDIPRTLEYLETQGVGVATFADGRVGTVDFPAFWTRDSGIKSPMVIRDEAEAAAIICKFAHSVGSRMASRVAHATLQTPNQCSHSPRDCTLRIQSRMSIPYLEQNSTRSLNRPFRKHSNVACLAKTIRLLY